ncbi:MAG: alpha/beta hydrolase [Patescibacteria group bacterium]|nr:alpha/beta hydrolase [Patescibacteria group bacterium]
MMVNILGQRVNYEVFGQGDRLLLLHGWATNLHSFEKVTPLLSQHFQVITVDLPGFGQSQAPASAYGVFDYANFIEAFLDYLDIKETFLLGHSMGGAIALAYILTHRRAKKIILEDSAGIRKKSLWTMSKIYIVKTLKLFVLPSYQQHLKHIFGSTDYRNAGGMRPSLVKLVGEDLSDRLAEIKQPTLIIWGQDDKTTTPKEAAVLNQGIKGSKLVIIPGCDHFPHIECPEKFVELVTEFL